MTELLDAAKVRLTPGGNDELVERMKTGDTSARAELEKRAGTTMPMPKLFPLMQLREYARGGSTIAQLRAANAMFACVAVPWDLMLKHERQAQRNHSQSIQRLAERGGLSAEEAVAVLEDRDFYPAPGEAKAHERLMEIIGLDAMEQLQAQMRLGQTAETMRGIAEQARG